MISAADGGTFDGIFGDPEDFDSGLPPATTPLRIISIRESEDDSSCLRREINKIAIIVIAIGVCGTTSYFGVKELIYSKGNIKILSICALFNGASLSAIFNALVPPVDFKDESTGEVSQNLVNEVTTDWAYQTYYAFSQLYLNLANSRKYTLPFIEVLGAILYKDVYTSFNLKKNQLSLSNLPPDNSELIKLVGFNTRDTSCLPMSLLGTFVISAVALTTLNFFINDQYETWGDLGKIGIPQDLIALFSGSVGGEILTRIIDDLKESMEVRYSNKMSPYEKKPTIIKVMRIAKNFFVIFTPLMIGSLLGYPFASNSLPDYISKFGVGALYGSHRFLSQRHFEDITNHPILKNSINQNSLTIQLHQKVDSGTLTTCSKIKGVVKKYFRPLGCLVALTGYMAWAAATNTSRVDYAILVLMASTITSFIFTDRIAVNCQPQKETKDSHLSNELYFRFIYFPLGLSIYYQYFTTKVDIEGSNLNHGSDTLYAVQLIAWFFWGLVIGEILGNWVHPKANFSRYITPSIVTQEMGKTFDANMII